MSVLVGFGVDTRSRAAVRFGADLARTSGEPLVLCCVVHDRFSSSQMSDFSGVSDDWKKEIRDMTSQAIADAKEALPEDVDAEVVTRSGRSVTRVLHTEAIDHHAQVLVTGSSVRGPLGRIVLGSTTDRLVHSSPLPIALVPRGYNSDRTDIRRLVFAVDPSRRTQRYYDSVARLAHWLGIGVEVVTFALRPSRPTGMGAFSDQGVYSHWRDQVTSGHKEIVSALEGGEAGVSVTGTGIVTGDRWSNAVSAFDWQDGDILVAGSSESALHGVFLGSTATHIMRHSPVPMVLLPEPRR
ncbi:universal stress protein [Brevibacterium sp. RIT 803]|uniref:universal stress protein n=1 Tax=Brevibacterium sp. RIT 803 TaxID=2810210 RepID=UPI0019507B6A|nr:universal stress protein [Brevibacterium sp. RIT 803]MBM6590335.1 universal stress protein [Brevibacterium sp. RIT 803]